MFDKVIYQDLRHLDLKKKEKAEKKEYRVEIQALFIKDVKASSPEEAKRLVKVSESRGNCYDGTGAFFYEPVDWEKAKVEENK